jgi:putative flippase GtrA
MLGLYGRLGLSVALGLGMLFWPYPSKCGAGLALYLAAVVVVFVSGVWSAVWSWRHRASRMHVLSLLLITWGVTLGALEVLPRVGYATPSVLHPANWMCK